MASPECSKAREWAALAPDGALSRLEGMALERHLARCPDCRAFAVTVRWLAGALAAEQLEAAPPIRRRLRGRLGRRRAGHRVIVAGAVAAVGLVFLSAGATREGQPPRASSPFAGIYGLPTGGVEGG